MSGGVSEDLAQRARRLAADVREQADVRAKILSYDFRQKAIPDTGLAVIRDSRAEAIAELAEIVAILAAQPKQGGE